MNQVFRCNLCSKTFAQKRYLKNHLTRCSGVKKVTKFPLSCSECDKMFNKSVELKRHQLHHSQKKMYWCTSCKRSFVQKAHLKRHVESVHGKSSQKKLHNCEYCEKSFATKWQTTRHERTMHAFALNLYKCRICGEKFDNQRLYVNHLEFHKGLKIYSCDVCSLAFQRKSELEAHSSAKHKSGHVFVCAQCDQSFSQRTQINRHIFKVHPYQRSASALSFEDDFTCQYCRESFVDKEKLTIHIGKQHFRKEFRSVNNNASNVEETTLASMVECDVSAETSSASTCPNFEWKTINVTLNFDRNFVPRSQLRLGRYLPQSFLSENPSLSQLEINLAPHVCNPGETIVIQVPVKVNSDKAADLPVSLIVNYVE